MTRHSTRGTLALVAAASLALNACSDETSGAMGDPSPSASSGATGGATDVRQPWKLLSHEPEGVPLAAGAYGLTANGVSTHVAVVRVPEGYKKIGGWTFVTDEPFRAMGFVTADRVPRDPCGPQWEQNKLDAAVNPGPSVQDLAEALVAQKGTATSKPVPVTVDGHPGLFLTYQVGKGIDVSKCGERAFDIFTTGPGAWYLEASRERAAIWILDVDGERLVLAWVAVPGVPRAPIREMTRMARSAQFVEQ